MAKKITKVIKHNVKSMGTIDMRFERYCENRLRRGVCRGGLCNNAFLEQIVLCVVVATSPSCYIYHVCTSLPFVPSQECCSVYLCLNISRKKQ
jgi:hypothetical protein